MRLGFLGRMVKLLELREYDRLLVIVTCSAVPLWCGEFLTSHAVDVVDNTVLAEPL